LCRDVRLVREVGAAFLLCPVGRVSGVPRIYLGLLDFRDFVEEYGTVQPDILQCFRRFRFRSFQLCETVSHCRYRPV
jgi:hypothetical protein